VIERASSDRKVVTEPMDRAAATRCGVLGKFTVLHNIEIRVVVIYGNGAASTVAVRAGIVAREGAVGDIDPAPLEADGAPVGLGFVFRENASHDGGRGV